MATSQAQTKKPTKRKQVTQKVRSKTTQEFGGFVDFIRTQGIVGLAIGFVIGTQAKVLVDQLTASFISPLLGLVTGNGRSLVSQSLTLTIGDKRADFAWGAFVFTLLNFIIIAAVIYFVFRWLKLDKLDKKKD